MGPMRAFLTNEQKLRLREYWSAQPQLTHFEVADWVRAEFQINVSRSTLYRISQAADDAFAGSLHKKKPRRVKFPAFENELLAFYHACQRFDAVTGDASAHTQVPLTGDLLARKAVELRAKHGIAHDKLKLSNGWLHSFKERHSLKSAPIASGMLRVIAAEGELNSARDGEQREEQIKVTEEPAVSDSSTAPGVKAAAVKPLTRSPAVTSRRPSRAAVRGTARENNSSTNDVVVLTAAMLDDITRDPASLRSPSPRPPPLIAAPAPASAATLALPALAPPIPPPPPPAVQPLTRILAKALSAVRSGTLNWELVPQQPPAADSHFMIVNDGIQILQDGVYQINVDLQHTTKPDAAFTEVFSVWNGTTRLDQCTSILYCDAAGTALSVSESQCFLAASACIRVDFKAPGYALPQSRIVIRLVAPELLRVRGCRRQRNARLHFQLRPRPTRALAAPAHNQQQLIAAIATIMSAEAELNAVKKIEANKYCVNCDAYNKFGHGNICEKFRTFVCSNCKSAHQSFSQRVKSVSMSNWSKEEVDALRDENGGGNAAAKRVWLGRWDESQMRKPTDKDHVDYFKKFINRVYNDRAFYDENPASASSTGGSSSSSQPAVALQDSSSGRRRSQEPASANLLDFAAPQPPAASFDAFSTGQWSNGNANPAAASTSPGSEGWGAFASAPAPVASMSSSSGFADFAAFSGAPPAAPAANPVQSFDPFGSSSQAPVFAAPPAAPVQPVSFDPFGSSTGTTSLLQPTPVSQQSVFGQFGAAPAPTLASGPAPPKNFSAFDALASPNLAYGSSNGRGYQQQPPMMSGGMGMGMNMARGPPAMGMNGGFQPQQPQYGGVMGGYSANPAASISTFMDPNANSRAIGATGYARPTGQSAGGRDPFAGLGLPHH